jgi:hypothetical protein
MESQVSLTQTYGAKINAGLNWFFGTSHQKWQAHDDRPTLLAGLDDLQALVKLASEGQVDISICAPSNYNYKTFLVIITEWRGSELWEQAHPKKRSLVKRNDLFRIVRQSLLESARNRQ